MALPFSIIIPVYAAGASGVADLEACLEAIRSSDGGNDCELIVVDDASPVAQAIADVSWRFNARHERLTETTGPAVARNRGAKIATQPILVFLDADTVPHRDTLRLIHEGFLKDPQLDALFGSYDDKPSAPGSVSRFRNLLHHWVHHHSHRKASTFWAGCGAVRKSAFDSVGGFNESYRKPSIEDVTFGMSLAAAGFHIELHPEIQVTHRKRWTLASAIKTDLVNRAIPWTVALWGGASLPRDLNFTWKHKASILLSVMMWTAWTVSIWLSLCAILLLLLLNLPFYRFLHARGGFALNATSFLPHSLHYLVSALGFGLGTLRAFPVLGLLPFLVALTQWSTGAYSADWGEFPDENAHAVTGFMVSEWFRNPTLDMLRFAERNYTYYPLLGLGHWPPLFYFLSGVWDLAAGSSRAAALVLIGILATLLLTVVYVPLRQRSGQLAGAAAAGLILFNPQFVEALSLLMLDLPTALAVIVAAMCWARYLDRPSMERAAAFGIAAALCFLLKHTAIVLAFVPPLTILITSRWRLVARPHFWIPAVIVLLLAGPWHWFTLKNVYAAPAAWGALGKGGPNLAIPIATSGWALFGAGLAGALVTFRKLDSMQASCLAIVGGCFLVVPLIGAIREPRHLLVILPALAFLAAPLLTRKWAIAAVLLLFLVVDLRWTHRPPARYIPLVDRLTTLSPGPVLLVANDLSEIRLVAALASDSPVPRRQWLRGSKFLAQVSWNGAVREEFYPSIDELDAAISRADLAGLLMINNPRHPPLRFQEKLNTVLARRSSLWRTTALTPWATLYERAPHSPDPLRTIPFYVPRLRREVSTEFKER